MTKIGRDNLEAWGFGPWPRYSGAGCYTLLYAVNGEALCAACARLAYFAGERVTYGTYDEGPPIACEECGAEMESSYGDPENTEQTR